MNSNFRFPLVLLGVAAVVGLSLGRATGADLPVMLLLGGVFLAPMAYRMVTPTPPDDLAAIRIFLKNRDETLKTVSKTWLGGPWGGTRIPTQTGRPYRVIAETGDGSSWVHILAGDGKDLLGGAKLQQRVDGAWSPVQQ
jgi:hypothetical protein